MAADHLKRIYGLIEEWLQPANPRLKEAIGRTVDENLFSYADISHQLRALKEAITLESLAEWADRNRLEPGELKGWRALCLHAGNLPLVGLQDLLACLLTGVGYAGKISRKDPYLLASLLDHLKANHPAGRDMAWAEDLVWSTDIDTLENAQADCVLFSGSGRSVKQVKSRTAELQLAKPEAEYLVRTAHFSLAYIDSEDPKTLQDLTEAAFRYGGKGCRSVAVVVSPLEYDAIKCHLTDYIESFWLKNPQHQKPAPALFYRYAYNKSVGHPQSWLDDFLIEETTMAPNQDFVLHWVAGDANRVPEYLSHHGGGIQSVYVPDSGIEIPGLDRFEIECERLSEAQKPSIDWKPDGIDSIQWLLNQFKNR